MMARVTVELPALLRSRAGGEAVIEMQAETPEDALLRLGKRYPRIRDIILDDEANVRGKIIQVFLGDSMINRSLGGMLHPLEDGDVLRILAPVAGG